MEPEQLGHFIAAAFISPETSNCCTIVLGFRDMNRAMRNATANNDTATYNRVTK
jgi:hypothetical protein